jgi:ADP-ribose pyrophosphatase YjhB (NUDIX family)
MQSDSNQAGHLDYLDPEEEMAALKRRLAIHRRNLNALSEQKAQYGLDVPLRIINGIGEQEQAIANVQARLKELESLVPPTAPKPAETPSIQPVDQAAAVCYRQKDGQIELLLVRTGGRRWMFPKGKAKSKEPLWRTAQRKAHEEAGASGEVNRQSLATFRHWKGDPKRRGRELRVAAFLLRVETTYEPREPDREPTWFKSERAPCALSEDRDLDYAEELARVVREACSAINALH